MSIIRSLIAGTLLATMAGAPVLAQYSRFTDAELAATLKRGGHVIIIRHGATDQDQADTDPLNPENIAKQRHLSEAGRAAARALGVALKEIGVPVGKVYTSHFHRAYETAQLAGLQNIEKSVDVSEGGLVVSPRENNRRAAAMKKLASTAPAAGTTTIIITHKPNIMDAFGRNWFDVREGEASIFKPEGAGYVLLVRIQMNEWHRIAMAAKK